MNQCVLPTGKSVGNPPSWFTEEPDGAVEGASGSQAQGGPHRVAPDCQQHPLQYGLRLPGELPQRHGLAESRVMCLSRPQPFLSGDRKPRFLLLGNALLILRSIVKDVTAPSHWIHAVGLPAPYKRVKNCRLFGRYLIIYCNCSASIEMMTLTLKACGY